ncbi:MULTISPECIES: helix-turn-helix transcriptional regulator [Natrialbaceae]|uniref:helix-turn-helix transcriptional regulator n=1 Tax=Natrialbaceae TaxID=1644061 RepID=UPI00207C56CC|nr:MarR family transcriptional regulator [Natronococcus sp. CG52]
MTVTESSAGSDDYDGQSGPAETDESRQELLTEAVRRSDLLTALQSSPASPSELEQSLDISRSTVHRALKTLKELNLVEKTGGQYELTGVGMFVARETSVYRERVDAAMSLEPFLNLVEVDDIPVEHFADAEVTRPKPRQPHYSVRRIIDLIERSEHLRIFSTIISPFYVDVAHREMLDGMEIQAIFNEGIIDIVLGEYEQEAYEAFETGCFDVYMHANLPFELFLFDDRIGMAAHDQNGIARVFVETQSEEAIDWATDLYERYLEQSTALSPTLE